MLQKIILLICLCTFIAGCNPLRSTKPIALAPEATTQLKIESVSHWQDIASNVADRIAQSIAERYDLRHIPIYLTEYNHVTKFSSSFYTFLKSELISRGIQVAVKKEQDNINLEYNVISVTHASSIGRPPLGTFTSAAGMGIMIRSLQSMAEWKAAALGAGVGVDLLTNAFPLRSDTEVIVSVTIDHNNRYVSHIATSYYINDMDRGHYKKEQQIVRKVKLPGIGIRNPVGN